MKPIGSFHPLPTEFHSAEHVLFAFAVDTPKQRRAVHDEAMLRLKAASLLSEALLTTAVDSPDERTHVAFVEAIAILSRDALGLFEVMEPPEVM